jgi:hypothetical protein
MARKRKNAGQGYGMTFHGAFGDKASAKKKERQVHGFIKPTTIKGERRYVVMSERKNPIRRKRRATNSSSAYKHALTKHNEAIHKYEAARKAYHAMKIDDADFLAAKAAYDRANKEFDAAFEKEQQHGNPSELVVLGANPQHKEIVLDPNTTYTIRTNPSAEAIREDFTGMPAEHYTTYNVEGMPAGDYAQLGKLLALYVKPVLGGQVREIRFQKDRPILVTDTTARQLYFVSGDQDISDQLGLFTDAEKSGRVLLGDARRIDYKQRREYVLKPHFDEWQHKFGEESGVLPQVYFDTRSKQLSLEGGEYYVNDWLRN